MSTATVIVPTLLGGPRLARLLESLGNRRNGVDVLVVDNGSSDPSMADLDSRFAGVQVIRLKRNAGYSRAVNIAAREATGDALVLVNDDCVCDPGFVEAITAPLDSRNGVVMAAGIMREARDPSRIDTAGIELDPTLLCFDYLNGELITRLDNGVADPIGPSGAAAAFDREAFLDAGGFDENLFAYWEDVDLALRLSREGARCALAPAARGLHEHSGTLGSGSPRKDFLMGFGRGYVLRKWSILGHPARAARALFLDGVICLGQVAIDRNLAGIAGRVRGYRAGLRVKPYPAPPLPAEMPTDSPARTLRRRLGRRARLRRASSDMEPTRAPRALAVLHAAEVSGPFRDLDPGLRWLAEIGSLDLVVPGPGDAGEAFSDIASITVLDYSPLMLPRGALGLPGTLVRLWREMRAFGGVIDRARPDVMIVVSTLLPGALLAARRRRVPVVVHATELHRGPEVESVLRRVVGAAMVRLTARLATEVIACSKAVASQFNGASRNGRAPVTTIYSPIANGYGDGDADAFRRRHGIDPSAACIVAVGNITRGRGQDLLIEALPAIRQSFPRARCVLVGPTFARPKDAAFERFLRELARDRGVEDAVTFAGTENRIADAYAAAAVVVNPARAPESFGRVACEALAAGRPVVATRVGAVPEVLDGVPGAELVPPEDPTQLVEAVAATLTDADAPGRAHAGGETVRKRFSAERSLEDFRRVIAGVIATDHRADG
ncbi:MAG TPA: glycosyltransferase [Solirubrobacterales bacterium]|nr:glycosyltransferase [Solirubrobacterales bacterium]